jgi:sulfoxide reductase heme-binding subunit YedZ
MVPGNKIEPLDLPVAAAPAGLAGRTSHRRGHTPAERLQHRLELANQWLILLGLLPLAVLAWRYAGRGLGPNPVETLAGATGQWALRLLWLTLAVTPLRQLTGWHWLVRLRRVPALFGFLYACLHALVYLLFDHEFELAGIWNDLRQRPFVLAGFASFLCLAPLAATSTDAMIKRLGGRKWRHLHRLAYVAAALAALHFLLLVKRDIGEPAVYILLLALLYGARLRKRAARPRLVLVAPPPEQRR